MKSPLKNKAISQYNVIKILKTFSVQEMKEFDKFINSPFYNNYSGVVKIYQELKKYYPDFSDNKITKETIFFSIIKGKKYDDLLFRKYLSMLNILAEEFLSVIHIRNDSGKRDLNILHELSVRNVNDEYDKRLKIFEKKIAKEYKIDGGNYLRLHELSILKYNHKSEKNIILPNYDDITDSFTNLINYFIFFTGLVYNLTFSHRHSFNEIEKSDKLMKLIEEINIENFISVLKNSPFLKDKDRILFLDLFINDIRMNSSENGFTAYTNLKNHFHKNINRLSKKMKWYYIQRMNVFCILEKAKGINDMNRELFENYKYLLKDKLYSIDGSIQITLLTFRAIMFCALKCGEFKWTEKFIRENMKHVQEEIKSNIYHYGNANLLFYKNKFNEALIEISSIKSESQPISIDIYILKAKIFYLLGYYDSAKAISDSFRHYIKRNNVLSEYIKMTFLNFTKHFIKIIRLKLKPDEARINELLFDLNKLRDIREKKWMIEVTSDLLKNKSAG